MKEVKSIKQRRKGNKKRKLNRNILEQFEPVPSFLAAAL